MTDQTKTNEQVPVDDDSIVQKVREKYGEIAEQSGSCCAPSTGSSCCAPAEKASEKLGYNPYDLAALPEGSDLGLGCGAPIHHLKLQPGETVLDLGSGAGVDVFIAAQQVGSQGKAIGIDMTPQMLERARDNAAKGGFNNVEFRQGRLESLPVDDASVDAVTSNCVINLVPDKTQVFVEVARVLKPGGRLVVVTFHSLEDRLVKRFLKDRAEPSGGSRHLPQIEDEQLTFQQQKRGAMAASQRESDRNPRARSAKLRAANRTAAPVKKSDRAVFGLPRLADGGFSGRKR
jgi:SAM-dependent methyltransferase